MIFLWAFLLLAAATGSVNSNACSCSCSHQQVIQETVTKESSQLEAIKFSSLKLDGVLSIVGAVVKTVTNLVIAEVNVESAKLVNGVSLEISIVAKVKCDSFQTFSIRIFVSVPLSAVLQNNYIVWSLISKDLKVNITVNDQTSTILGLQVDVLLKALLQTVTTAVNGICHTVVHTLNILSKAVTTVTYIRDTACSYELTSVNLIGGNPFSSYCLNLGGTKICPTDLVELKLLTGEFQAFTVTNDIIGALFGLVTRGQVTKIQLDTAILTSLGLGSYGPGVFLHLAIIGNPVCAFGVDGITINVLLEVQIHGTKHVLTAQANVVFKAQFHSEHGYWGLLIDDSSLIGLDVALALTYSDTACGCKDTIIPLLQPLVNFNLRVFLGNFNCAFRKLMPLLSISGLPGSNGNCVSYAGYGRCGLL